jgi:hypothetical protein
VGFRVRESNGAPLPFHSGRVVGQPETPQKRAWGTSMEMSSKMTSRPRSCEFGLDLTSGLPVIQEFLESIHTSRLQY